MLSKTIVDGFVATLPSLAVLLTFLRSSCATAAAAPLPSILFLALVFYHVGAHAPDHLGCNDLCKNLAKAMGLLTFVGFCLQTYATNLSNRESTSFYIGLAVRGFLILLITDGAFRLLLPLTLHSLSIVITPFRLFTRIVEFLGRRIARFGHAVSGFFADVWKTVPPPAPPFDPLSATKGQVEQAKREFEATAETIRASGLDEDETESALLYARQKYLKRIHGVFKQ